MAKCNHTIGAVEEWEGGLLLCCESVWADERMDIPFKYCPECGEEISRK